jgi:hypothetical protein
VSRLPLLVTLDCVDQIEQGGGCPKPFSPIFNRPVGVRLWKFIYKCLNQWIRHGVGFAIASL